MVSTLAIPRLSLNCLNMSNLSGSLASWNTKEAHCEANETPSIIASKPDKDVEFSRHMQWKINMAEANKYDPFALLTDR